MKIIRLKKGDLVVEKITAIAGKTGKSGVFWGLGALEWANFMHYNLKTKKYSNKRFERPLEVVSMFGVIAQGVDKKMGLHVHACVTDDNFVAYGGHLDEAMVAATLEVAFVDTDQNLTRYFDQDVGLNLLKL